MSDAITSDKQIEHATSNGKQRDERRVPAADGLWLRITATGHKSFIVRVKVPAGKVLKDGREVVRWRDDKLTLGTYPAITLKEACKRANEARATLATGVNPAQEKQARRVADTFGDIFAYWYAQYAVRNLKAHEADKRRYDLHVAPHLGGLPAKGMTRKHVADVREYVAKHSGGVSANRTIALVIRVLNYAVEESLLEFNVAARMRKAIKEKAVERIFTDDELARLWQELDRCEHWRATEGAGGRGRPTSLALVRAIRITLLTGQRRGEVIAVKKADLLLTGDTPVWTIPDPKNGELHRVPLAPLALFEFRRAVAEAEGEFVFPSPKGHGAHVVEDALTKATKRMWKRLGVMGKGVSPHAFRRTEGTGLAKLKVSKEHRALVLNHTRDRSASETTRVYDRYGYDDEKRDALLTWENHIRGIVGLGAANVATLRG